MTDAASVAIVTGGAQGLGAAICRALLDRGCKVCLADIQKVKGRYYAEQLQEQYGSDKVIFSCCDVTKEDHYERTFESTLKAFGGVDILVNNAGMVLEQDPRLVLEVNLMGPIIGCQMAFKYMGKSNGGKGGIVINTASILGLLPVTFLPVYAATKHGVVGLTRSYGQAYHLEKDGLLFAAIAPSFTQTDMLRASKETSIIPGVDFTEHPDIMSADDVAKGVIKILDDRINGSILLITKKQGFQYIGYQEELANFPIA